MKYAGALVLTLLAVFSMAACGGFSIPGKNSGPSPGAGYSSSILGNLVYVPAGSFQRDSDASNISQVAAFRMSPYEVGWDQYESVMGLEGVLARDYSDGSGDSPAQYLNWYMAIAFCNKLSLAESLEPVYYVTGVDFAALDYMDIPWTAPDDAYWDAPGTDWTANGYRLPTEAEWTWAAMGADKTDPGQVNRTGYLKAFAGSTGSNSLADYAVFGWGGTETGRTPDERSDRRGSKLPNELGLYDLSGNVSEWCFDWYAMDLPAGTLPASYRGPTDSQTVTFWCRVIRGGSWFTDAANVAVADRASFQSPWYQGYTIGFRVVRK